MAVLSTATNIVSRSFRFQARIRDIPAFSYGVVHQDKLIFTGNYGYANRKTKVKPTAVTGFRIASISKTFTATAVMQLVERRLIRLDDYVVEHLPWFRSKKDRRLERITIRQLLTHTAGLSRDGNTTHWVTMCFPTVIQIKTYIKSATLCFDPNQRWKYSNLGYAILGELIATVTGQGYADYIKANIFSKLAMDKTSVDVEKIDDLTLAIGYGLRFPDRPRPIFPTITTAGMAAATGYTSCIIDLAKFISAQFTGNQTLLTEESKRELRRIQWLDDEDGVRQEVGFRSWKMGDQTIYSHSGGFQGFKTIIALNATKQIGIVILTNAINVDPVIFAQTFFHTLDQLFRQYGSFTDSKASTKSLKQFEGTFLNIWGATESVVVNRQLALINPGLKPMAGLCRLSYLGRNRFLAVKGPGNGCIGQEVRFEFNKKGRPKRIYVGATPSDATDYFNR